MLKFKTIEDLKKKLLEHGIDYTKWKRDSKTIEQLFSEYQQNERVFTEDEKDGLMMYSEVLNVFVYNLEGTHILCEEKIVHHNGSKKERGFQHISEKLYQDEDITSGCIRALKEELSIDDIEPVQVQLLDDEIIYKNSGYFPGVRCIYKIYKCNVTLFAHQYKKEGYIEKCNDKDIYFSWVFISTNK